MQLTHGIVTDDYLLYLELSSSTYQWKQQTIDAKTLTNIGKYIDLANMYNLTQLWVLPGTNLSESLNSYDDSFVTSCLEQYRIFPNELDSFMVGKLKTHSDKYEVSIVLPAYTTGLPQSVTHMTVARDMYALVTYLQTLLGVPFTRDAKGTGINLLADVNSNRERKAYLKSLQHDFKPFYQHKQSDLQWSRALLPDEQSLTYLHGIDRNYMYLAATSELHIGANSYEHIKQPSFDKKHPGVWLVSLSGDSQFNGITLPDVCKNGSWLDTAIVQTAIECGYRVTIDEAYLFTAYHTPLNPWYDKLRTALYALMEDSKKFKNDNARIACIDTLKMLYRQTIGLTGRPPEKNERIKWYNRPDMYNAVVGESVRRMFLTMREMVIANIRIVGVYVDAIYFVSDKPINAILPEKVQLSTQIGKYKHIGSYPLADVKHVLTTNPQTLVKGLAKYKGGK